jgi:hypothetical protein
LLARLVSFLPFVLVAVLDCIVVARAWASPAERLAVIGIVLCIVATCALVSSLVADGVGKLSRSWRMVASLPISVVLAVGLAETHLARTYLGSLAGVVIAPLLWAGWIAVCALARIEGRWPRRLVLTGGVVALIAQAVMPVRLYPSVRSLVLVSGVALITVAIRAKPRPGARVVASTSAAIILAVAAAALSRSSANVRFVSQELAPATGLVLRMLEPARAARSTEAGLRVGEAVQNADAPLASGHLVLITVDALRADAIGAWGAKQTTPTIDGLARSGVRFQRAYAQAPSTAISITSLLTGIHPDHLDETPTTLAELLQRRRWFTQAWYPSGLFFDGRARLASYARTHFGFEWADTRTLGAREVTDAALARIQALRDGGEPRAFLWIHYFDPHEPYEGAGAAATERYASEIAEVDRQLGRLLAGVRSLQRPSVIVLAADHGEEFGEHGGFYHGSSVYEEQVRVPLIIAAPGILPRVSAGPAELVDVVPTVAGLLGIPLPPMEGRPLSLDGMDEELRDAHAQVHSKRMLVRGDWKLIHDVRGDVDELYDLASDPFERRNVFDRHLDVAGPLHEALDQWFQLPSPRALVAILSDGAQSGADRANAARDLGASEARDAVEALHDALGDPEPRVRAEAALALGELKDRRALPHLAALLENPPFRRRAGLMLGRLGDSRATEALIDCLNDASVTLRRRAVRGLGLVGDDRAVPALTEAIDDLHIRTEVYLALGRIASRTPNSAAVDVLASRFGLEPYEDAGASLIWALGMAGDARVVPMLLQAAAATPVQRPILSETLVRLGTFGKSVAGVDFTAEVARAAHGLDHCRRSEAEGLAGYLGATTCLQSDRVARLRLHARAGAASVLLRARSGRDEATELVVSINGTAVSTERIESYWSEPRIAIPSGILKDGPNVFELAAPRAGIELDHLLIVPDPVSAAPEALARVPRRL